MGRVINSVKRHIRRVLAANTRFNNYVIATFGDPYRRHVKRTTNAGVVASFLNRLNTTGGGDCPEFALSGAIDAAAVADRNSVMMLFTDASAKDAHRGGQLAAKLKEKSIRFFAVASGNLCNRGSGHFSSLARSSGGHMASLRSRHFGKVSTTCSSNVS